MTTKNDRKLPNPPADLTARGRGRDLWRTVTTALELDARDTLLLHEACRLADRLDILDEHIRTVGAFLPDTRISPAVTEARQQAIAFARVLAALRLPADLAQPEERPQQRTGVRPLYAIEEKEPSA